MSVQEVLASLESTRTIATRRDTVKALGGDIAMAAMLQQLSYRQHHDRSVERWVDGEGNEWCNATRAELAYDLGLSVQQVKRLVEKCRAAGLIDTCQPFLADHDRRLFVRFSPLEGSESPEGSGGIDPRGRAESTSLPIDAVLDHSEVPLAADAEMDRPPSSVVAVVDPPKPTPRARDLVYDAIAQACGVGLPAAKAMNGQIIAAKRDITEVEPGRSPEDLAQEVPRRAAVYRKKHPDWALTPNSLAKWWSTCAPDERNMREAYAQMDPVERLKVRLDLQEQGLTGEQIKEITG